MNPNATTIPHARAHIRVTATRRGTTNSPLTKHCVRALPVVPACNWSTLASHVPSYHDAANGPSKPWGQGIAVASATLTHISTDSTHARYPLRMLRPSCHRDPVRQTDKQGKVTLCDKTVFLTICPNPNPKTHLKKRSEF